MLGIPKYIIDLSLQLLEKEILEKDIDTAKTLALSFFRKKIEDAICLHKKCNFITYLWGYSIKLTRRSNLYLLKSKDGKILVQIGNDEIYHKFEYEARKKEFIDVE